MPRKNKCQDKIDAKRKYMPRENRVEKSRVLFSCQAQHFVQFWEIAVVFFHTKGVSKMGGVRSPKRRVRDDDFMVGSWSDHARIMLGTSSNRLFIGGSNSGLSR